MRRGEVGSGATILRGRSSAFVAVNFVALRRAWLGGTLGAALTGAGWHPRRSPSDVSSTLVSGGPESVWPGASPYAVYGATVGAALLVVAPVGRRWSALVLRGARRPRAGPAERARRP